MSNRIQDGHAQELRDTSVVYLLELPDDEGTPNRFVGYWEGEVDGRDEIIEGGPGWNERDQAIGWGRARASVVVLSHEDGTIEIHDARCVDRD